jgi:hypothetical protein
VASTFREKTFYFLTKIEKIFQLSGWLVDIKDIKYDLNSVRREILRHLYRRGNVNNLAKEYFEI